MKAKFIPNFEGDLEIKNPHDINYFKLLFFDYSLGIKKVKEDGFPLNEIFYSDTHISRYKNLKPIFEIKRRQI
jgi:hypothetical protein